MLTAVLMTLLPFIVFGLAEDATNDEHAFPVVIGAIGHIVHGRIPSDANKGSHVPSNMVAEGSHDANPNLYIRMEIRQSRYKRRHVFNPDIKDNANCSSSPGPCTPQLEFQLVDFTNNTLPFGMEFIVVGTDTFSVDQDHYLVVNDFSILEGRTRIHFDIILRDSLAEPMYVSNHLPLVVEVEYSPLKSNYNAALFCGILILLIIAISLLIPFTVRAKRRRQSGKPICGCGSADSGSDCASDLTDVTSETKSHSAAARQGAYHEALATGIKRSATEEDFNALYTYLSAYSQQMADDATSVSSSKGSSTDFLKSHNLNNRECTDDIFLPGMKGIDKRLTIQNKKLCPTSTLQFMPRDLDPHYNHVHIRPDYYQISADGSYIQPDRQHRCPPESSTSSAQDISPETSITDRPYKTMSDSHEDPQVTELAREAGSSRMTTNDKNIKKLSPLAMAKGVTVTMTSACNELPLSSGRAGDKSTTWTVNSATNSLPC